MSTDNKEQSIENLLNKIKDTVSDFDLHSLLKVYSNNFNTELLEVLRSDLKRQLYFQEIFMYEDLVPETITRQLSLLVNNNIPIPFIKSNSKEAGSYQIKINDYVQNNVEELKSFNGYRLEREGIKSQLYKILSDLLMSEIDIKEVFDLEKLIYVYEFANHRKFIELIDQKLIEAPSVKKAETLKWKGTKIEFVELSKALIESNLFDGTQKEIVAKLSAFFEIDIKTYDQKLTQIKGRNNGSETLFLDQLKQNLDKYTKK